MIATLHSLPYTGSVLKNTLFKIDIIFPQRDSFEKRVKEFDHGHRKDTNAADRGDTLVGKSNTSGMYLATIFPFIIGALANIKMKKHIRLIFFAAVPIILAGLVFTYSRASYLSLGLLLISYIYLERKIFKNRILPIAMIGAIGIGMLGFQSDLFKFDFLIEKFDLTNEQYEGTNNARLLAYVVPWQLIADDPLYLFRGAGQSFRKLRDTSKYDDAKILNLTQGEQHSTFSSSVFYRGFLATIAIFYLYYLLTKISWRMTKSGRRSRNRTAWLPTASLISMIALLPGWATDHYFITKISAHMYLFLLISLVMASHYYYRKSLTIMK